jgi:hypothetical protein
MQLPPLSKGALEIDVQGDFNNVFRVKSILGHKVTMDYHDTHTKILTWMVANPMAPSLYLVGPGLPLLLCFWLKSL